MAKTKLDDHIGTSLSNDFASSTSLALHVGSLSFTLSRTSKALFKNLAYQNQIDQHNLVLYHVLFYEAKSLSSYLNCS